MPIKEAVIVNFIRLDLEIQRLCSEHVNVFEVRVLVFWLRTLLEKRIAILLARLMVLNLGFSSVSIRSYSKILKAFHDSSGA